MFIKGFATIFLILFYVGVLMSKIIPEKDAGFLFQVFLKLFTWSVQAIIGSAIMVAIYNIWY